MPPVVLVVDDDTSGLEDIQRTLLSLGYAVHVALGFEAGQKSLAQQTFDLLLVEVNLSAGCGQSLLRAACVEGRARKAIAMGADAGALSVLETIRAGASDFLLKPIVATELSQSLKRSIGDARDDQNKHDVVARWRDAYAPYILGDSPALLEALSVLKRVASTDLDVLLYGPSGTGKELFAQAFHQASDRAQGPFVALNCAAIPSELLESELFGWSKGAYTGAHESRQGKFAQAHGGTLLLDEVGELDLALQGKFLRVIQEKEITPLGGGATRKVDVRIVAATNQDLLAMCAEGRFREDLYYRLNVVPMTLPTLAQRRSDIEILARYFARQAAIRHRRVDAGISSQAMSDFEAYAWPGNIRELKNAIERIMVLKPHDGAIASQDLPEPIAHQRAKKTGKVHDAEPKEWDALVFPDSGLDIRQTLERVEIRLTQDALKKSGGNRSKAAQLLGLKRTTLVERLKKLNLTESM